MIALMERLVPNTLAHKAAIPYGVLSVGGSIASISLIVLAATATTPLSALALSVSGCVLGGVSGALFQATADTVKEYAEHLAFNRREFNRDIFHATGFIITQTVANAGGRFARSIAQEVLNRITKIVVDSLVGCLCSRR